MDDHEKPTLRWTVFFNISVNPIALEAITWKYSMVLAVILAFILLTVILDYSETRGYNLEEIALVFDKYEAPVAVIGLMEEERRLSVRERRKSESVCAERGLWSTSRFEVFTWALQIFPYL